MHVYVAVAPCCPPLRRRRPARVRTRARGPYVRARASYPLCRRVCGVVVVDVFVSLRVGGFERPPYVCGLLRQQAHDVHRPGKGSVVYGEPAIAIRLESKTQCSMSCRLPWLCKPTLPAAARWRRDRPCPRARRRRWRRRRARPRCARWRARAPPRQRPRRAFRSGVRLDGESRIPDATKQRVRFAGDLRSSMSRSCAV